MKPAISLQIPNTFKCREKLQQQSQQLLTIWVTGTDAGALPHGKIDSMDDWQHSIIDSMIRLAVW